MSRSLGGLFLYTAAYVGSIAAALLVTILIVRVAGPDGWAALGWGVMGLLGGVLLAPFSAFVMTRLLIPEAPAWRMLPLGMGTTAFAFSWLFFGQ